MVRLPLSGFWAYLTAFAGVVAATMIRSALDPILGENYPYAVYIITLLLTIGACGPGPSAMALVLGVLAGTYFFLPPFAWVGPLEPDHVVGVLLYLTLGIVGILITESHRRARRRAEEATGLLHALLSAAPIGLGYLDRDCRYISINESLARLNGHPAADHLGKPVAEMAPALWPDLGPVYRRVLATGQPDLAREFVLEPRSGLDGPRTLQTHTYPVRIEGQGIVGIGVTVVDLTERIRLERDLKASEERLRRISDQTAVGIATFRPDGSLTFANPGFRRMTGRGPDEIEGTSLADLLPDEGLPRTDLADVDEARLSRKDGSSLWVSITATTLRDDDGNPQGSLAIVQDVSARRTAEAALRESHRQFQDLADAMPQMAFTADAQGLVGYLNRGWVEYTGMGLDSCRAFADLAPIVHPDDRASWLDCWALSRTTGVEFDHQSRLRRSADGSYRWFLFRAVPVHDDRGAIVRWFGTSVDIHELRQAEQELRDADRRKDEFLAMLAHELRNPLAPIRNGVEVLELADPGDDESRQWAREVIGRQVRHLTSLVDDLLDVSRITRGKITLNQAPIDVSTFVQAALESSRPLISSRNHVLEVDVEEGTLPVHGDATRLAQVVTNLLNNAAKYTPEGGRIRLSAHREGDRAVVRVADNGEGIAPEMISRVFELFEQASRSIDRSEGGLGIGLTLAKRLVEMHGGTIEARSEGPGKGSEFVVGLPRIAAPAIPAEPAQPVSSSDWGRSRRILLVDDNVDSAESLARLLVRLGHQVTLAHDGPSAIEAAATCSPELALLDLGLPGMDGYEVARRLRRDQDHKDLLLIALTGYGSETDRRRSREAGFDDHLVKPVEFDAIRRILTQGRNGGSTRHSPRPVS